MSEQANGHKILETASCILLMVCGALITLSTFLPWINMSSFIRGDFPSFNVTGWNLVVLSSSVSGNPFGFKMNGPLGTGMLSLIAGVGIVLCAVLFLKNRRGLWKVLLLVMVAFSMAISIMNTSTISRFSQYGHPVGYGLSLFLGASCVGLFACFGLVAKRILKTGRRARRSLTREVGWRFACGASLAAVGGTLVIASVFLPWTTTRFIPPIPSSMMSSEHVNQVTGWDTVKLMGEGQYLVSYLVDGKWAEDPEQTIHGNPFYMWEQEVAMFSGVTILIAAIIILLIALALMLLRREWLAWALVLASIYLLILTSINFFSCIKIVWWSGRGGIPGSYLAGYIAPSYLEGIRVSMGSGMWLMFAASLACPFGAMMAAWGYTRLSPASRAAVVPAFRPRLRPRERQERQRGPSRPRPREGFRSWVLRKPTVVELVLLLICATVLGAVLIDRLGKEKALPPLLLMGQPFSSEPADAWMINGTVEDIALDGPTAYIGGDFDYVGPATGNAAALDLKTGEALPNLPQLNGDVYSAAPDGAGGWYIGGKFYVHIGDNGKSNLVHFLAGGSIDENLPSPNDPVRAIAVSGGTVYIGGDFLAAIGPDGQLTNWSPGANGKVCALWVEGDVVYAGGEFSRIGEAQRQRLAAIGKDGAVLDWNPGADGTVNALAVRNGVVYAGGSFNSMAGQPRTNLAAVDSNGSVAQWNPGTDGPVLSLAVYGNSIYAAGSFGTVGGEKRNNAAAIGANGRVTAWNPGFDKEVRTLAVKGGTVYAGGDFESAGGEKRMRLAAIGADGRVAAWPGCADNTVNALALSGGSMLAGGMFTSAGGVLRDCLAAIGPDGKATPWNPGANSSVKALVQKDGVIYAGGDFSTVGGQHRGGAAAIDREGRATGWNPDVGGAVWTMATGEDLLYIGGNFESVGGQPRGYIASVDLDGNVTDWDPGADNSLLCLAVDGETVYAGGDFERIGGEKRKHIAALGPDGKATRWKPEANDSVQALAVSGDTIYAGGDFTSIGGKKRSLLAAIGPDGKATPWNPDIKGVEVDCLALYGDLVYAAGGISMVGDKHLSCIVSIGSDGRPTSWDPPFDELALALETDGSSIYVGGSFREDNNTTDSPYRNFARFDPITVQLYPPTQASPEDASLQVRLSQPSTDWVVAFYQVENTARKFHGNVAIRFKPGTTKAEIPLSEFQSDWGQPGDILTLTLLEPTFAKLGNNTTYSFPMPPTDQPSPESGSNK